MSKTILLIEDNFEVRENTAEILELADYKVITAEHGKVGVQLAKEHIPDLIICDIMMPELDGYGVLHILSRGTDTSSIPFIFLTAKADKSDFRKGMNLGADDYITKPFDETELLDAIESRMKKVGSIKSMSAENANQVDSFIEKAGNYTDLEGIKEGQKLKKLRKKDTIYHEGDYPNYVYYIESGKVKISKINEDGKEYIVDWASPGEFLGYMAVIQGLDHSDSAIAMEDSEVYLIPRQDFISLMYDNRDISSQFIKLLSSNLVQKEEQLLALAYDTVRKRVVDSLLSLKSKYDKDTNSSFKITIARNDLASMVGTATESVIRVLSGLKDDGYIAVKGSEIEILNEEGLKEIMF